MNWWLRTSWSSVVCPPCHYLCSRQMKNRSKNKKTTRSERRKFRRKGDFQGDSRNSERKEIDHKVRPQVRSNIYSCTSLHAHSTLPPTCTFDSTHMLSISIYLHPCTLRMRTPRQHPVQYPRAPPIADSTMSAINTTAADEA